MRKISGGKWICLAGLCLAVGAGGCGAAAQEGGLSGQVAPESGDVTTAQEAEVGQTAGVTARELLEAYNPYIGDAPADGRLIGRVKEYFGMTQKSTAELQTSFAPCGLILHFEEEPDSAAMQKASAVLMGLIGNCYSVSWDYPVDEDGNREYFYLPKGAVYSYVDDIETVLGMDVKAVGGGAESEAGDAESGAGEAERGFEEALKRLEELDRPLQARAKSETVDQAVSAAILEHNRYGYAEGSEAYGEGHEILDTEPEKEADGLLTVYALTMYGGYQFQDGNFVKDGGSGVIPAVIRLIREPDGRFVVKDLQQPRDGGDYPESIQAMFPDKFWERCISTTDSDREELKRQEQEYALEYLRSIGREAAVGDYSDFSHPLLTEADVSVEVSNRLSNGLYFADGSIIYAPFWLGNVERLEDGKRYLYEQAYDSEKHEIVYSKIEYGTKEVLKQAVYDSVTGELKN